MATDSQAEIAASVAALQDLGPGYDQALGSMLVALPVTAIVLSGSPGVAAIMLMALVWVIVGIINVACAMRKYPPQ